MADFSHIGHVKSLSKYLWLMHDTRGFKNRLLK